MRGGYQVKFSVAHENHRPRRGGGGTLFLGGYVPLGPLAYTRAGSAEFCYPILD